jgi:hypothetical protein
MSKPYPWSLVTTVKEIDSVIAFAELEVLTAQTRKANIFLRATNSARSLGDRTSDLSSARVELNSVISQQTSITDVNSDDWKRLEVKRRNLDSEIYALEFSLETSSAVGLITGAYNENGYDFQISEAQNLLAGARARKTELS